jgi:DNA-binding transcriptional LysR family regulator
MNDLNWNLLRSFIAVAEGGSLSAAARNGQVSQPTLGRHISELEDGLGVLLFERHRRGLRLSERGTELYARARPMRSAFDGVRRLASGLSEELEGTVRISASEVVATYALPTAMAALRADHPGIQLEIVADNRVTNLLRRDADVAVRMLRPTQPELIARQVAEAGLGLYAAPRYLRSQGVPGSVDEAFGAPHTVLGLDRDDLHLRALSALGRTAHREDFAVRSDGQALHVELAVAGVGIAGIQHAVAAARGGLERVLPDLVLPSLPVWLVAHADLHRSPRIRIVYERLASHLGGFYAPAPRRGPQVGKVS